MTLLAMRRSEPPLPTPAARDPAQGGVGGVGPDAQLGRAGSGEACQSPSPWADTAWLGPVGLGLQTAHPAPAVGTSSSPLSRAPRIGPRAKGFAEAGWAWGYRLGTIPWGGRQDQGTGLVTGGDGCEPWGVQGPIAAQHI